MKQLYKLFPVFLLLLFASELCAQNWGWAVNAKGNHQYSDADHRIATDHEGNSVIAGYYTKTFTLGSFTLTNSSDYYSKIYLAKVDASGTVLWLQDIDAGNSYDDGIGIALDDNGNSYLTGTVNSKIFVSKYNAAGKHIWTNNFSGAFTGYGKSIALDQADNIYVTGKASNSTYYLGGVFLAKLANEGKTEWTKVFESECHTNGASGGDIAVDALGNSYITGLFACTTLDFDGVKVQNSGGRTDKTYIAKVNPKGKTVWAKQLPNLINILPQIALTETNELVVAGYCCSYSYLQLQKHTTEGDLLWVKQGKTYEGIPREIKTDYEGNIYLGGNSFGNYGGTEMDFHVEKYTPDGEFIWKREVKTKSSEYLYDISLDNKGNAYLVGRSGIQGAGMIEPGYMNEAYTTYVAKLQTGSTTHLRPHKPQLKSIYSVCKGEAIPMLEAAGESVTWYASPASGNKIHTGNSFTPAITQTDTFYVSQTVENRVSWRKPVVVFVSGLNDFNVVYKNDTLFAPASDTYTYQWFRNDTLLTGNTFAYHVPDTTGMYKVMVSDGYCTKGSNINLKTLAVGDDWQISPFQLRAFPNPSPGTIRINVSLPKPTNLQVNIYNTSGLKVYTLHAVGREEFMKELDLHHLPNGMYIMEAIIESDRRTVRFLKN